MKDWPKIVTRDGILSFLNGRAGVIFSRVKSTTPQVFSYLTLASGVTIQPAKAWPVFGRLGEGKLSPLTSAGRFFTSPDDHLTGHMTLALNRLCTLKVESSVSQEDDFGRELSHVLSHSELLMESPTV